MAFKKRNSRDLDRAEQRVTGLTAINPNLDLGNGMSISSYTALVTTLRAKLEAYNIALAQIDASANELDDLEKQLADFSERMLAGVAFTYGKDSSEYEKAGGTRKSDRKRTTRQPKTPPNS